MKGSKVLRISVYLPNGDFKSELYLKSEPCPVACLIEMSQNNVGPSIDVLKGEVKGALP